MTVYRGFRVSGDLANAASRAEGVLAIIRLRARHSAPAGYRVHDARALADVRVTEAEARTVQVSLDVCRRIRAQTCDRHGVTLADLDGDARTQEIILARTEAMARCRQETGLSLGSIGRIFGGRDATTVRQALGKRPAARESGTARQRREWAERAREVRADVCARHGLTLDDMDSRQRDRVACNARREAILACRQQTGLTCGDLARIFGRDYTTILAIIRTADAERAAARGRAQG